MVAATASLMLHLEDLREAGMVTMNAAIQKEFDLMTMGDMHIKNRVCVGNISLRTEATAR